MEQNYSDGAISKLVAGEFREKIGQGLASRHIYKLLHPVAMHYSEHASREITKLVREDICSKFATDDYASPQFLSTAANPGLEYMMTYGKGFFDGEQTTQKKGSGGREYLKRSAV